MPASIGVALLAVSLAYNGLALSGRFHPMWLRMRAHGGLEHLLASVLGSLSFKAVLRVSSSALAFWPVRKDATAMEEP